MIELAYAYIGTTHAICPDCGERLTVPHDWTFPLHHQPTEIVAARRRVVLRHARELPILHPKLLPEHHAVGVRRR